MKERRWECSARRVESEQAGKWSRMEWMSGSTEYPGEANGLNLMRD